MEKLSSTALRNATRNIFGQTNVIVTLCKGQIITPPPEQRSGIIKEYHNSFVGGHKGITKTYRRIRERYFLEGLKSEVLEAVRTCQGCQKQKLNRIKTKQPMLITDTPADAFEKVSLDTVGPLPTTPNGNRHILTIQDNLTKYCLAIPITDTKAITIYRRCICTKFHRSVWISKSYSHR